MSKKSTGKKGITYGSEKVITSLKGNRAKP
jgi:hypothetical protein